MKTNILLAIRNILKNRINSVITLLGLSIAFACLFLIFLYVSQETSYNIFHQNSDRLFRVNYSVEFADGNKQLTVLLDPKLSEVIKDKVPQVKKSTAFRRAHNPALKFENHNLDADLCITEPDFFSMFSFKLVIGNKNELFKNPDEIVISRSLASKFQAISACTTEALIGKPVFFANTGDQPFIISGIMEDVPKNSSLQFEALIPYKYEDKFNRSSNMFGNSTIFYETDNEDEAHLAEVQVIKTIQEYNKGLIERLQSQKVIAGNAECFSPFVQRFTDVYLGEVSSDDERSNNRSSLYILSAIGLLILLIACSNFVLLSLGQSLKKIGEVGIRKVMGAKNGSIFRLFFTENILVTLVALVLGCGLCFIILPVFNRLSQNEIYTELIKIPRLLIFSIACILLIVTTTSMVPVLKLVKIKPGMLASKSKERRSNITSLFVTLQYGLSIFLIILTIFILRQTNYMKNSDLGLSSENIINLTVYHLDNSEKLALKEKLLKNPGIVNLSFTDRNYVSGASGEFVTRPQGENIATRILRIDQNYIPTLGLKLIQGKNFEEGNLKEGDKSVIINEELLSRLGFSGEAVGQTISMNGKALQIIGVVKNFHFDSMKDRIEPLIFFTNTGQKYRYIFVKCGSSQLAGIIPFIKETWSKTVPDKELDLQFWDEQLAQRYQSEDRWGKIISYAAFIAILLSSLGLFGFTVLEINKRVKEVGIRKVSGATISEVLIMLNRDFVKWVVISFVIATPLAYYAMNKWLENFAYKTTLSWWIFAVAGLVALGIAMLTVSFQSWKAATRNPVEALRYE